ncbi:MAG: hypothetical protein NZM04_08915 [Methylacidiphilales bacterium]|nr:hypothetical protein [Candidatus Methylacidiphilales bacterium]
MHASDYLEKFRLLINRMMPLALINAVLALIGVIFTLLKWEKLDRVGKGLGLLPAMLFIIIFFDFNNWMYYTTKEGGFIDMVLNKFSSGK